MNRLNRLSHRRAPRLAGVAAGALAIIALPIIAFAHAVVFPKASAPGAYERYTLRVPNEKAVATMRIELLVPKNVRVISFGEVRGWELTTVTDTADAIVGAVWMGVLPPKRFVELPFMAVNPKTSGQVKWAVFQTYADGERVEWSGDSASKTPASVTRIGGPEAAVDSGRDTTRWIAVAALVIAIIGLGLAIRRPATTA